MRRQRDRQVLEVRLGLVQAGRQAGFLPYRMHMRNAASAAVEDSPYWRLVTEPKKTLAPLDLLSPGRWSLDAGKHGPSAVNEPMEHPDVAFGTRQKSCTG